MRVQVEYTDKAIKELKKLDISRSRKIVHKIGTYSNESSYLDKAKKLKSPYDDLYRYRIGDYRAVFSVDAKECLIVLTILRVKHKKDIYR